MKFEQLVSYIEQTHKHFQQQAAKAVNVSLTIRNWLIGYYIVEFEQNGTERAAYGEMLIQKLMERIQIKGLGETNLKTMRIFYQSYPFFDSSIRSLILQNELFIIRQTLTDEFNTHPQNLVPQPVNDESTLLPTEYVEEIIGKISYSHFIELIKIQDENKRRFFELLTVKTTPSVRELKKQINSLTYERLGLSFSQDKAMNQLLEKIVPEKTEDAIKNIYNFDFLGIRGDGLIEEKDLETALLNHLQEFIHELGLGFCFEYRQKRILIDDEYYFADLVFYHRILKCHVIIELKVDAFKHEYLSQLNTYVAFYNAEVKRMDDNPAIGILLCTEKGKKLVEFATAGMDNQLFVSKYLLELPQKAQLEAFIKNELRAWK